MSNKLNRYETFHSMLNQLSKPHVKAWLIVECRYDLGELEKIIGYAQVTYDLLLMLDKDSKDFKLWDITRKNPKKISPVILDHFKSNPVTAAFTMNICLKLLTIKEELPFGVTNMCTRNLVREAFMSDDYVKTWSHLLKGHTSFVHLYCYDRRKPFIDRFSFLKKISFSWLWNICKEYKTTYCSYTYTEHPINSAPEPRETIRPSC